MKTSSEYRALGKEALTGRWSAAVIATLVYLVIGGVVSSVCSAPANWLGNAAGLLTLVSLLVSLPLGYGYMIALLGYYRNREQTDLPFESLFEGFKDFSRVFGTLFLVMIYVMLWSLLLVIPGIIKSLQYSMTYFVLKDHPEMSFNAAIEESMRLMKGHLWELFCLLISFIGWLILCILTLGIGSFWVIPWMEMSMCAFYEDLVREDAANKSDNLA